MMGNRKSCDFDITTYMLYIFLHMSIIQIPRKRNVKMFISKKTINGSIRNYFHENLLTNLFYPSHIFISFRLNVWQHHIFCIKISTHCSKCALWWYFSSWLVAIEGDFKLFIFYVDILSVWTTENWNIKSGKNFCFIIWK